MQIRDFAPRSCGDLTNPDLTYPRMATLTDASESATKVPNLGFKVLVTNKKCKATIKRPAVKKGIWCKRDGGSTLCLNPCLASNPGAVRRLKKAAPYRQRKACGNLTNVQVVIHGVKVAVFTWNSYSNCS